MNEVFQCRDRLGDLVARGVKILGLTGQTTSKRFMRAIKRIRVEVQLVSDFSGGQDK